MNVVSHGIDLVEVSRVRALIERHPERAVERLFTQAERVCCEKNGRRRFEHYAVRFAAKEAVLKALGTGWSAGVEWTDVEVIRESGGRPGVRLSGVALKRADHMHIARWTLSLSHTADLASASAIALSD